MRKLFTMIIVLLFIISAFNNGDCGEKTTSLMKIAWSPSSMYKKIRAFKRIMIVTQPTDAFESWLMWDALAAELLSLPVELISRTQIVQIGRKLAKQNKSEDENKALLIDDMTIARKSGATAVLYIALDMVSLQSNVYNEQTQRVGEVRSKIVLNTASTTLVDPNTGSILAAGIVEYKNPVGIVTAAKDIIAALN